MKNYNQKSKPPSDLLLLVTECYCASHGDGTWLRDPGTPGPQESAEAVPCIWARFALKAHFSPLNMITVLYHELVTVFSSYV